MNISAIDNNGSPIRAKLSTDQMKKGRFPCAARPHERRDFSSRDRDINAIENFSFPP